MKGCSPDQADIGQKALFRNAPVPIEERRIITEHASDLALSLTVVDDTHYEKRHDVHYWHVHIARRFRHRKRGRTEQGHRHYARAERRPGKG